MLLYVMVCNVMQCSAMLCYVMLCCGMLWYVCNVCMFVCVFVLCLFVNNSMIPLASAGSRRLVWDAKLPCARQSPQPCESLGQARIKRPSSQAREVFFCF